LQNNESIASVTMSYGSGSHVNDPVNTYGAAAVPSLATGASTGAQSNFNPSNYTITYIAGDIIVDPAALTITANDQTKIYGTGNPELTLSYLGFVNNEDASVLIPSPTVNTTANLSSPVGKYPITVSGAGDQNYDITYVPGTLTIIPINTRLIIPNTFTPNGDGINDKWIIGYIEDYPNATVNVFNRYGQKVLTSIGYNMPWDGTYNGVKVPVGTYYYIIDTKTGNKPISGWVAVIR